MGHPIKIPLNSKAYFVTTSVEEGLMLPPNPLIELVLLKCLAQAQGHYKLKTCHFLVEPTHIHFIVVLYNPDDLRGFMERFKCESAHAINRLLGRKKRTIWCEGYDSPIILDVEDAVKRICYIYSNPSKDGLVDSINSYPGLSSWNHYLTGKSHFDTYDLPRTAFRVLPKEDISEEQYQLEVSLLTRESTPIQFEIYPDEWMASFEITDPASKRDLNERIARIVILKDQEFAKEREAQGKRVIGSAALRATRIGAPYQPDRKGKRMLCLSTFKETRKRFINFAKDLIAEGRKVLARWRNGELDVPYPLGLYPPSLPKMGEMLATVCA